MTATERISSLQLPGALALAGIRHGLANEVHARYCEDEHAAQIVLIAMFLTGLAGEEDERIAAAKELLDELTAVEFKICREGPGEQPTCTLGLGGGRGGTTLGREQLAIIPELVDKLVQLDLGDRAPDWLVIE